MKKVSTTKQYFLVETETDIDHLIGYIEPFHNIAFDTETTGLNTLKDKVIGYSFTAQEGTGYYIPVYSFINGMLQPHKIPKSRLLLEKLSTKKLIMHNASFDCRVVLNNFGINLLQSLHSDTMLAEHTLNEEGPFGLKDMAIKYAREINLTQQEKANQEQETLEKNVLKNGGKWKKSEKDIYKADLDVLAEYAVADTDLTLRIFNFLESKLHQENLHNFFYKEEVMPLYKYVTIPMEHRGLKLDMPKLQRLSEEIKVDINKLEQSITEAILNTEEGKLFIQKRIESEIEVKPSGSFAQEVCSLFNLNLPKNDNGKYSITKKNLNLLKDSVYSRFLKGEGNLTDEDIYNVSKALLIKDSGLININSKQQLGMLTFDVMGLNPLSTTEKGSPQFNEDFVDYLADKNLASWAGDLKVYNKLVKISGSSYERFLEEQQDGVFYPYYKQHGTTSGRYSSNVQQLPRPLEAGSSHPLIEKYTNEIRSLFVSFDGYKFIDDDYESLEPRCFSDDSSDASLIEIFEKGEDFYSKVAIMTEGMVGVSAHKKDTNFLKNVNPSARQTAKAYALGIRYGMKAGKLAAELNCEKEEAQKKIDDYFKAFPNLKQAMDGYLKSAKEKGIVRNSFGRVRHLPMAQRIYSKYGDDILDYSKIGTLSRKFKVAYSDLKQLSRTYNNLLNNALNFPIQSKAASLVNRAAIAMSLKFIELGLDAWVCAQIHDQIVVCCKAEIAEQVAAIVQDCMENTNKLSMKLIAKPEIVTNLKDGH